MPNYEYRCQDCRKRFDIFMTYAEYGTKVVICPHCQSGNVHRRIGRVRIAKSNQSRMESLADPTNLAGLDEDPQSLGRMMRQMSENLGEDMGPEFNEVVDRLQKGQSPDEIERDLPDLADDTSSGADDLSLGGF